MGVELWSKQYLYSDSWPLLKMSRLWRISIQTTLLCDRNKFGFSVVLFSYHIEFIIFSIITLFSFVQKFSFSLLFFLIVFIFALFCCDFCSWGLNLEFYAQEAWAGPLSHITSFSSHNYCISFPHETTIISPFHINYWYISYNCIILSLVWK